MVKNLVILAALLASGAAEPARPAPDLPMKVSVNVFGAVARDDRIMLTTFEPEILFSVPASKLREGSDAERALLTATEASRSIALEIDWANASFDEAEGAMIIPVCAVKFEEIASTIDANCGRKRRAGDSGEGLLAHAIALWLLGDFEKAAPVFDAAVQTADSKTRLSTTARKFRADNEFTRGFVQSGWSEAQDRHFLAALADMQLVIAKQDTDQNRTLMTNILARLGAYEEAMAIVSKQMADGADPEHFQATINAASIARLQGKPEQALDLLDALRSKLTREPGMKFFYHRGRTLMMLGRYDEAVADFTSGIANQPDYSSAYFLRGCAHSALGEPSAALADYIAGEGWLGQLGKNEESVRLRANISAMIESARGAGAINDNSPNTEICRTYLNKLDDKRPRSALLPATL